MTNMYPHLLSAIKAANDVRTERDATNGNLDTFISAVVPLSLIHISEPTRPIG